jgi:hypothetical protein
MRRSVYRNKFMLATQTQLIECLMQERCVALLVQRLPPQLLLVPAQTDTLPTVAIRPSATVLKWSQQVFCSRLQQLHWASFIRNEWTSVTNFLRDNLKFSIVFPYTVPFPPFIAYSFVPFHKYTSIIIAVVWHNKSSAGWNSWGWVRSAALSRFRPCLRVSSDDFNCT